MSGDDFFDKRVRTDSQKAPLGELETNDNTTQRLLQDILKELRAIHWHLAEITENSAEQVRRDS